ncbi:MAG TPA: sulfotransferase [Candidatus Sumerlaeota bacterium]|nr:sulfotransferase [Candidatus Sumerlaeota bacterium]
MFEHVRVLVGMPRSGTSWLSQIIDSCPDVRFRLSPIFSYAFKNCVNEQSARDDWEAMLRGAYELDDEFMTQARNRRAGHYPSFPDKATAPRFLAIKDTRFHNLLRPMLGHFPELKLAAVVRDPRGAIHSWLTAPREFPPDADPLLHWRSGACRKHGFGEFWGFDDWKAVTRLHRALAAEFPDRFLLVAYEDFVAEPFDQAAALFQFMDLPWSPQTERFLAACHQAHDDDPYAVFKNPAVRDRWRSELQPQIRRAIERDLAGTDLEVYLR